MKKYTTKEHELKCTEEKTPPLLLVVLLFSITSISDEPLNIIILSTF